MSSKKTNKGLCKKGFNSLFMVAWKVVVALESKWHDNKLVVTFTCAESYGYRPYACGFDDNLIASLVS